jgi:hypothetical protein
MIDDDVEAAFEYVRRFRKGLPSDRFCDGHTGAVKVARGIEKLAEELAARMVEEYARGLQAMEAAPDPCRR